MASFNRIGSTLGGRYQIQELLGQGGMSSVYKALDPNLQRIVAVKMIHPHMSGDPKFSARFEDEARAVARLRHPNIVQVFDFNHDEDIYYMVQEYLPGESLQALLHRYQLSREKLSSEEAIRFTVGICSAIDYAHKLGMIHRDIKPANIMIDERGQAILMDFGIVKLQSGDSHTTTGTIVGTIAYMPPDLIRGDPPEPRSDIYSLGVTLFEMLTGQLPFHSDSAITLMMMVQNNPVPDLHQLRTDIPEDLVAIIKKSLAKSREDRFRTAGEMGAALNRVLDSIQMGLPAAEMQPDSTLVQGKINPALLRSSAQAQNWQEQGPAAQTGLATSNASPAYPTGASKPVTVVPDASLTTGSVAAVHEPALPKAAKNHGSGRRAGIWIGAGVFLVVLLLTTGFVFRRSARNQRIAEGRDNSASSTLAVPAPAALATQESAAVVLPTATTAPAMVVAVPTENHSMETSPLETPQLAPTSMQSLSAAPSIPLDIPFIQLSPIQIDNQDRYVVDFEVLNLDKTARGDRAQFYFNTAPLTISGVPQEGFFSIFTEVPPYMGLKTTARDRSAVELCVLVAHFDGNMIPGSGTCRPLPDVNSITSNSETICRYGPGEEYPEIRTINFGRSALVEGLSPDESWWYVRNPAEKTENCWVSNATTTFNGDITELSMVQPPPIPTGLAFGSGPFVEIKQISVNDQARFVVEYISHNFSEKYPGTHMHYFFNTVPENEIGIDNGSGNRLSWGGPSPFSGYKVSDVPPGADSLCVLVANPDHTVQPASGNCFKLPEAP